MKTITGKFLAMIIIVSETIFSLSANASPTCSAPTGMNTTNVTSSSAKLNWTAASGAQSYEVQYKLSSASNWTSVTGITTTNYTLNSLSSSSAYQWQVRTRCSSSSTSSFVPSTPVSFTTLVNCVTPTGLNASSIAQTTATLNWTAVSGAASYNIQYRVVGAPSWTPTTSTTNSKAISSLTAGTNYEFQVQTNCGGTNTSSFSASLTICLDAGVRAKDFFLISFL